MPGVDCGSERAKYCMIRVRNPPRGKKCRTPTWGHRAASSVVKGAKVTVCKYSDGWDLQRVMVPKNRIKKNKDGSPSKIDARKKATRIRKKIKRE